MFTTLKRTTLLLFLFISALANSQTSSNSPYSAFGIGEIRPWNANINPGMGNVSTGIQNGKQINYANPASYIDADSNDFVTNFAFSYLNTQTDNNGLSATNEDASIDHLAIKFPITKYMATSFGYRNFSKAAFETEFENSIEGTKATKKEYSVAKGGIRQLYWGYAFKYNDLSAGFNLSYLWGDVSNNYIVDIPGSNTWDMKRTQEFFVSDFLLNLGVQYIQRLSENSHIVYGATYQFGNEIDVNYEKTTYQGLYNETSEHFRSVNVPVSDKSNGKLLEIPAVISVGASYKMNEKWLFALDYTLQEKSNLDMMQFDTEYSIKSTNTINTGLEYTPKNYSKNYFELINYRLGASYSELPYKIAGTEIRDFRFSLGFGLPFPDTYKRTSVLRESKSIANITFEYGTRGEDKGNLVKENYWGIKLNINLNNRWFFKRKYF